MDLSIHQKVAPADVGPRSPVQQHLLVIALVCLAATLPYVSTLHNYFVNDDFGVVQLFAQKPAFYFPRWFVSSWTDRIWGDLADEVRPFPAVSYQLTALWGGASPVANHVMNIAIHAANGVLVLAIARVVAGLGLLAATCAALVFVMLPVHAESVAWITGRVDTIPAFFYFSSFVMFARWRRDEDRRPLTYVSSVGLFFLALFSKQNTVTMVPALVLYDWLVAGRRMRVSWNWVRPYVPFILLTVGYLWLRYLLFGEVAREGRIDPQALGLFKIFVGKHLQRAVLGGEIGRWPLGYITAVLVVAGIALLARTSGAGTVRRPQRLALYFGPVWWLLGVGPIVVAGYESPRHVYVASLGWAILVGLALQIVWRSSRQPAGRVAASVLGAMLLGVYVVRLQPQVADWNTRAAFSKKLAADLEREALEAPRGSLLIVGAPIRNWEWALPFAAQPPFVRTDLTMRVFLASPMVLSCCRTQWEDATRQTLRDWSAPSHDTPVIALRWDPRTGALATISDREDQRLRPGVLNLLAAPTRDALNSAIEDILARAR